jgi:hypothetical protein
VLVLGRFLEVGVENLWEVDHPSGLGKIQFSWIVDSERLAFPDVSFQEFRRRCPESDPSPAQLPESFSPTLLFAAGAFPFCFQPPSPSPFGVDEIAPRL